MCNLPQKHDMAVHLRLPYQTRTPFQASVDRTVCQQMLSKIFPKAGRRSAVRVTIQATMLVIDVEYRNAAVSNEFTL